MKDNKQALIDATYKELYHYGYQGTSLSKILLTSKLTKGALYHYFKSKKEISLITIESVIGSFIKEYWEIPAKETKTPYETLFQLIHNLPTAQVLNEPFINIKHGCFLNNLIQEMSPLDEDFSTLLQSLYKRFEDAILLLLKKAQDKKELTRDEDINALAMFITTSIEASISIAKLKNDIQYYYDSSKHIKRYCDLLNTSKKG